MSQFKKNATVRFQARVESGEGKIIEIIESARGLWYKVRRTSDKKEFCVRAAQLELA